MNGDVIIKGAPSAKFIVNGNTGAKYNVNGMGGVPGKDGTSATIIGATASIDETSGTPSVTVTNGGTESARSFDFAFTGLKGEKGDTGAGLSISGSVNTYSELPSNLTESDAGTAYFVQADGKLYVWSGSSWPADGDGAQFQGPAGPAGADGKDGPQGPAGTNATITGATASVTNTTGTPSVTVTAGGTESARSFDFAFTNLKGDKGDTGAGLPTTGGGNNEVLVSGAAGGTDATWSKITQKNMGNDSVGTSQLINKAVTSDKVDWTKLQKYYKACPRVSPFNISTAWQSVTPSGWTLTFPTNSGEIYKVEIVTEYLRWDGSAQTELDMRLVHSGAEAVAKSGSMMTGTYSDGVSIGRRASGILKATGNSMTVEAGIESGATGNYARIERGYILAERIA